MIIASVDIETTGLKPETDKITEIGIALYKDGRQIAQFNKRVNPMKELSAEARRITGLSWEVLKNEPLWKDIGTNVNTLFHHADLVIGHNLAGFDIPFIQQEQTNINLDLVSRPIFDTIEARWATAYGKLPRLEELAWSLGLEYDHDRAHSALYDAELCAQCFFEGVKRGFFEV